VDSHQALEIIKQHPDISLALIDFQMPGLNGAELTNTLRGQFPATEMGIIGITVSTDPFVPVMFLKAGANDVLRKPFIVEELVSRVNSCIDNLDNIKIIADQANHDYLTQLYNRRYLFNAGNTLFSNAKRDHIKLTVAILDIDFFKNINDTCGHEAGDAALIAVASELKRTLRSGDIVARIGGEEFCIVAVNVESPLVLVEHMRSRVESLSITGYGKPIRLTLSAGFTSKIGESFEAMLRTADAALYQAKESGRNCSIAA
jgi:diguanylate cyclase (GGDEF)-like protein